MMNAKQPSYANDEVLVRVEGVSKKFCRSLKRSLWYGVCDIAGELNPFARHGAKGMEQGVGGPASGGSSPLVAPGARDEDLREGEFYAVRDVSFELRRGECLGLIGHNGAGKTTLLKMLNGLIKPDRGRIEMNGRVGALIALGAGFNPILTGRENIYINGSVLGLSKKEIDEKIDEIIDFAEIGEFIDMPVQNYSSGMSVRLGFAVATALDPDILILDEVLAVGDAGFRSKCFQRIGSLIDNCAVIFVSHDLYSVRRICSQVVWLKSGAVQYQGLADEGLNQYSAEVQSSVVIQQSTIAVDYIRNITSKAETLNNCSNGFDKSVSLSVEIGFYSHRQTPLGMAMLNIVAPGEQVIAQAMLTKCLRPIHVGQNKWRFSIPSLHISNGSYTITLGVFEPSNTKFLLNIRNFAHFQVQGTHSSYPVYTPHATNTDCIQYKLQNA
jgi:lipopolysaccharide transport system ATP-binding protein